MMKKLIDTIICGEMYITQITYDALQEEVRVTVRGIMRTGPNNCEFGFDESRGIEEGVFVLTGVKKLFFDSDGWKPHDLDEIIVDEISEGLYKVTFNAVDFENDAHSYHYVDATFVVVAENGYLIDTRNPDVKIRE